MPGERVRTIVRDLRVFSRSTEEFANPSTWAPRCRESSLRSAHEIRHRANVVRLFRDVHPGLPNRRCWAVLLNVIVNRPRRIPEVKRTTTTRSRSRPDARRHGPIEVTDTGGGIAPEVCQRIFRRVLHDQGGPGRRGTGRPASPIQPADRDGD
jgi:signal transduction histidine kinase